MIQKQKRDELLTGYFKHNEEVLVRAVDLVAELQAKDSMEQALKIANERISCLKDQLEIARGELMYPSYRRFDIKGQMMKELNGKKILNITGCEFDSVGMYINFTDGSSIHFYHEQDCCESVYIEDVVGNPESHIGAILYGIDEKSNRDSINTDLEYDSFTWTFYTIRTSKGYLDIRWFGSSNGYYGEGVSYNVTLKDNQ